MILALFVGESFAELSVVQSQGGAISSAENRSLIEHQRWYLPRQSLKTYLQNWASKTPYKPDRVIIASRFLYKLAGHRLGGSVAQIVTQGFEKWSQFSLPEKSTNLRNPQRIQSISSQELIFPVLEKISSEGKIEKPLNLTELEAIEAKLKLLEIKRVCLHFVNSEKNPSHQNLAKDFFLSHGYEIFEPDTSTEDHSFDHFRSWKTNTLNAATSGTFEEMKAEIVLGLQELVSADKIFFLNSDLSFQQDGHKIRLSSLFAIEACLFSQLKKQQKSNQELAVVHLGLEHFSFIKDSKTNSNTPWGLLSTESQAVSEFQIQPTSMIELSDRNSLLTSSAQSYEPGPIRVGRGQKPLVADLLFQAGQIQQLLGLDEKQMNTAKDRWKMILQTWQRTHRLNQLSTEDFENALATEVQQKIAEEIRPHGYDSILVYGFFARETGLPGVRTQYVSEAKIPKSYLVACEALDRGFL